MLWRASKLYHRRRALPCFLAATQLCAATHSANGFLFSGSLSRFSTTANMIVVHHLEYSQSFRILWLLEELGEDYEIKTYKRTSDSLAPPEYKEISPLGTSPAVTVGGVTMAESNAIMEYILDQTTKSNNLRPKAGSPERVPFLFWFHAAQGSLMPILLMSTVFNSIKKKSPPPISWLFGFVFGKVDGMLISPRLDKLMDEAEKQLSKTPYFAGKDLTAADITLIYAMSALGSKTPDYMSKYPSVEAWLKRVKDRPKFESALKRSGDDKVEF